MSKKILVAYSTTEGQTRKIAGRIGDWIRERGHDVCVMDCEVIAEGLRIDGFDAYIIAGSLHLEKHQASLVRFVKANLQSLQAAPGAFLSVSATAARNDPASAAAAKRCIDTFCKETGWVPTTCFPVAGAIMYTKYNFFLRLMMRRISKQNGGPIDTSRDHELTDWNALQAQIDTFLSEHVEPVEASSKAYA